VWHHLTSNQLVQGNPKLRAALLGIPTLNFEEAYELVNSDSSFTQQDRAILDTALTDVFLMMDDAMVARSPVYDYKVNEMIGYFVRTFGEQVNTGYIFTLNQDRFFERKYIQHVIQQVPAPVLPGISPHGPIFSPNMPRFDRSMVATIPSNWSQVPLVSRTNIIKLHGSFNWRASGSGESTMVIGTSKTSRIAGSGLLSWYFDIFRSVLNQGDVKLMVVGYGFGDDHINEAIADAVKTTSLKIYFWDTSPNLQMKLTGKHRGAEIWQGYMGSLTERVNQVFPPDQSDTPQCRSLFDNFFGVKVP
jgi:hypothetical protein